MKIKEDKISRAKLSRLMEAETWMDATKAVELGFADDILQRTDAEDDKAQEPVVEAVMFSRKAMNTALLNKLEAFLKAFERLPDQLPEFTLKTWHGLVDYVTVYAEDDIRFTFKNGQEVKA